MSIPSRYGLDAAPKIFSVEATSSKLVGICFFAPKRNLQPKIFARIVLRFVLHIYLVHTVFMLWGAAQHSVVSVAQVRLCSNKGRSGTHLCCLASHRFSVFVQIATLKGEAGLFARKNLVPTQSMRNPQDKWTKKMTMG